MGWNMLNGGQVFRDMADSRGMTLEEFSQHCMEDESIDKQLDEMLSSIMISDESPEIIESRLAGWWAFNHDLDCPRIWIEVSEEVRAERVVNREGRSHSEQLALIRERMEYDGSRYKLLYGIEIDSKAPYTCVIQSDELGAEEVLNIAIEHLEEYS